MRITIAILFVALLGACAILKPPTVVTLNPISVEQFMESPFGHNETIEAFNKALPARTRVQKLIRRQPGDRQRPDTIYNFIYKQSKISVYKTQFNQEYLLGGSVKNPNIELVNGIQQGMEKKDFFKAFTDIEPSHRDTVTLRDENIKRTFTFLFNSRGRLERYAFTGQQ